MYIFKTKGVCAREIHFDLEGDTIKWVRYVGGGCPGNAETVARLLKGERVERVIPLLKGIPCREKGSCPDQLAHALSLVREGLLEKAPPIPVQEDPEIRSRVFVLAELNGDLESLEHFCREVESGRPDAVYCLGNQVMRGGSNDAVVERVRKEEWICVQGPADRMAALGNDGMEKKEGAGEFFLKAVNRDCLLTLPLMCVFQVGSSRCLAFYDGFLQDLDGFSDYSPYSTELIVVSNLSDYLQDEDVFPAVETMTRQFSVDAVLFAHTGRNKHVRLGTVDLVNVGALNKEGRRSYAVLEQENDELAISFRRF
ncbi:MAG: TIGR03905 family TSCPD domain-containing protein [Deltaproteobacteria bacterium]|nr:TIGR03905 family TSCPD domain-containing protein [Deltaproteobacteria bacterium]